MPQNTMFFTFSCSHLVQESDFMEIIKRAALHAGREIILLKENFSLEDHPKDPYHPFSEYLKSLFFWIK